MKLFYIFLISVLLSGCSIVPKMPSFGLDKPKAPDHSAEIIIANNSAKEALAKIEETEAKSQAEIKKIQDEYAKTKLDIQKAYDDLRNKDLENFYKIGELNYGVYYVTQEKKKIDINTTIAHLRSKEIMMRTDKLTDAQKTEIQKEVADEKQKTIDIFRANNAGSKNPNWKGGTTKLIIQIRNLAEFKTWRMSVYKAGKFTCAKCGTVKSGNNITLDADHIVPLSKLLSLYNITTTSEAINTPDLWDIANGRCLCRSCHKQTPTWGVNANKTIKNGKI